MDNSLSFKGVHFLWINLLISFVSTNICILQTVHYFSSTKCINFSRKSHLFGHDAFCYPKKTDLPEERNPRMSTVFSLKLSVIERFRSIDSNLQSQPQGPFRLWDSMCPPDFFSFPKELWGLTGGPNDSWHQSPFPSLRPCSQESLRYQNSFQLVVISIL